MHEKTKKEAEVHVGSDRSFGLVFAIVFVIIGLWPLLGEGGFRIWALVISAAFLGLALIYPKTLHPLNVVWFKFGMLIHKVMQPLILGILYFTTVVPIGILMRLFGKDPMNRRFDLEASSYWIARDDHKDARESMRRQF